MDLGCCLDSECVSVSEKLSGDTVPDLGKNESDGSGSGISASKVGKKSLKETGQSPLNALNKFTSQIKKPPHRRGSPLNWFPRKKVDSYLKRKIKLIQEVGGMNATLDDTLGDSNPHYSRVLREKIAAREAAHKAMEARKAALVEASWCRILRAARIGSKEAEVQLLEAEKTATEAFEAAEALGVIMYDIPNCSRKPCQIETSSVNQGTSTTHTVAASFETAFKVDKEVAAAVKTAFTRLANCSSFSKDEFKDLIQKISQNPDTEFSSEYESESGSEHETLTQIDCFSSETRQRKYKKKQSPEKYNVIKLEDMMLERLQCLQEDELSSLATIVATCGLNAALAEVENSKPLNCPRRLSSLGGRNPKYHTDGQMRRKQIESELPSLDKFLVKHMSKLEKEVEEAKNSRRSKLEGVGENADKTDDGKVISELPSLDKFLVKHMSKLEKEVEEAKITRMKQLEGTCDNPFKTDDAKKNSGETSQMEHKNLATQYEDNSSTCSEGGSVDKENIDLNKEIDANSTDFESLDKVLVKHVSRLEKEKMQIKSDEEMMVRRVKRSDATMHNSEAGQGLDQILVKHVSRIEKEKMAATTTQQSGEEQVRPSVARREAREKELQKSWGGISLGNQMHNHSHKSRLQREKLAAAAAQQSGEEIKSFVTRKEMRERELQEAWGGLSLGNSMKPHLSKLERDKAAWTKAEEEERRQGQAIKEAI